MVTARVVGYLSAEKWWTVRTPDGELEDMDQEELEAGLEAERLEAERLQSIPPIRLQSERPSPRSPSLTTNADDDAMTPMVVNDLDADD
eukprot:SAG11_NODE_26298_length_347_cov_0.620968_1_plen_88_part_10